MPYPSSLLSLIVLVWQRTDGKEGLRMKFEPRDAARLYPLAISSMDPVGRHKHVTDRGSKFVATVDLVKGQGLHL